MLGNAMLQLQGMKNSNDAYMRSQIGIFAYDIADNGNRSDVHWEIVLIQRPDYGGGEIWFDDVLIRKDGEFILPELKGLNQEN